MIYSINYLIKTLKETREQKKLSQRELAQKIGIPQSHLSKIENGKVNPSLSIIIEMARALELEMMLIPRQKILMIENILQAKTFGKIEETIRPAYVPDKEDDDDGN